MSILVTRPSPAGEELVACLRAKGYSAYHTPLISFSPGSDLSRLPAGLAQLRKGDLLFALSPRAVDYANSVIHHTKAVWPSFVSYYAIGQTTGQAMQRVCGHSVVYPLDHEISESLLQLPSLHVVTGKHALIMRGNGGRELICQTLRERGATVSYYECYQRNPIHFDGVQQSRYWQQIGIDTLIVTSGEMLQQLYTLVPKHSRSSWLLDCRVIVVSERLAILAQSLGWKTILVADNADNAALMCALQ